MNGRPQLRRLLALGMLAMVLCSPGTAAARKLYPVDEGPRDRSFVTFRARLLDAAKRRDHRYLIGILDPQIRSSFGNGGGVAGFRQIWHPERPNSRLWPELVTILSLGGTFDKERQFWTPYVFSRFPDDVDGFEHAAITGQNVRLRAKPASNAAVVGTLSYDIVKVHNAEPHGAGNPGWVKVTAPSGQQGYVDDRYVRRPIEARACFRKKQGKWRMTLLVEGD